MTTKPTKIESDAEIIHQIKKYARESEHGIWCALTMVPRAKNAKCDCFKSMLLKLLNGKPFNELHDE